MEALRAAVFLMTGGLDAPERAVSDDGWTALTTVSVGVGSGVFLLDVLVLAVLVVCDFGVPVVFLAMRSIPTAWSVMD